MKELESIQERKSCLQGINQNINIYSVIIEVMSLQMRIVSKNEQVEELQSKLEKKDKIVKELDSIQERKSCYFTVELISNIIIFT